MGRVLSDARQRPSFGALVDRILKGSLARGSRRELDGGITCQIGSDSPAQASSRHENEDDGQGGRLCDGGIGPGSLYRTANGVQLALVDEPGADMPEPLEAPPMGRRTDCEPFHG